jgi:drug/metabolite transporter (DMT)-like permease
MLLSISGDFFLAFNSSITAAGLSLTAASFWGVSDFTGGYASRRVDPFLFATLTHVSGALLMILLALLRHSPFPSPHAVVWSLAGGALAGIALAVFYSALATGKMGLTTPVAAVLSAAIPAGVGMITEGWPGRLPIFGFALAGAGIWLISRPEGGGRPTGLGLAVLAGLGFAGYFLCMKQAGEGSAIWIAGLSRASSFVVTAVVVLVRRHFYATTPSSIALAIFAGCVDVSGSALFVRAMQSGRLDAAVVLSSLYPAITVILAWLLLKERFSRWKTAGMVATLMAVPLIALQ